MEKAHQQQEMKRLIDSVLNGSRSPSLPLNSLHTAEEVVTFLIDVEVANFAREMQTLKVQLMNELPEGPLKEKEFIQVVLSTNRAVNIDMKLKANDTAEPKQVRKQRKQKAETSKERVGPKRAPSDGRAKMAEKTASAPAKRGRLAGQPEQPESSLKKKRTIDMKEQSIHDGLKEKSIHDEWLAQLSVKRGSGVAEERTNTSQLVYKINELLQLRDVQVGEISSNGTEQLLLGKIDEICAIKASSELSRADQKKLQGWRVHMLLSSGHSANHVANLMKLDESTIKRSHSIYQAIAELGKLRYYTGNMDELRKVVSLLRKEAKRTGQVDKWNLNEHPQKFTVNGVEMLSLKYLLGIN